MPFGRRVYAPAHQGRTTLGLALVVATAALAACSSGSGGLGVGSAGGGGGSVLPEDRCRESQDCGAPALETCFAPGQSAGCGVCWNGPDPCNSDQDCQETLGAEHVCGPPTAGECSCGDYAGNCSLACTSSSDCEVVEDCGADGHCRRRECAVDGDCADALQRCPPTFHMCVVPECDSDAECDVNSRCNDRYQCVIKICSSDADCEGYCVNRKCYDQLGTCGPMPR